MFVFKNIICLRFHQMLSLHVSCVYNNGLGALIKKKAKKSFNAINQEYRYSRKQTHIEHWYAINM